MHKMIESSQYYNLLHIFFTYNKYMTRLLKIYYRLQIRNDNGLIYRYNRLAAFIICDVCIVENTKCES